MRVRYIKYLYFIFISLLVSSMGMQAHAKSNERMQFGLFGFKGEHVVISINSIKAFDSRVDENAQFFFFDSDSKLRIVVSTGKGEIRRNIIIDKKVKGFKITQGSPINIQVVEYYQGID